MRLNNKLFHIFSKNFHWKIHLILLFYIEKGTKISFFNLSFSNLDISISSLFFFSLGTAKLFPTFKRPTEDLFSLCSNFEPRLHYKFFIMNFPSVEKVQYVSMRAKLIETFWFLSTCRGGKSVENVLLFFDAVERRSKKLFFRKVVTYLKENVKASYQPQRKKEGKWRKKKLRNFYG